MPWPTVTSQVEKQEGTVGFGALRSTTYQCHTECYDLRHVTHSHSIFDVFLRGYHQHTPTRMVSLMWKVVVSFPGLPQLQV